MSFRLCGCVSREERGRHRLDDLRTRHTVVFDGAYR